MIHYRLVPFSFLKVLLVGFLFGKYIFQRTKSSFTENSRRNSNDRRTVSEPYKYLTREQKLAIADYADDVVETLSEISEHELDRHTSYTLTGTTGSIVTIIDGEVSIKELPQSD